MQLAIELPDELGRQVLQHEDVQEFAKIAFERMLLEEKKTRQQKELMALIKNIKSVKSEFTSEQMVRHLRDGVELKSRQEINEAKKRHLPETQLFIGVLANSSLDERDYKRHLEDKYL